MTKVAYDNRDEPFSDWLRNHPELDSYRAKLDVSDNDFIFHKYQANVDNVGTREVKLMCNLEVKVFGKQPDKNQLETLFYQHQLLKAKKDLYSNYLDRKVMVWHFGQYCLTIYNGKRPDNCKFMKFGIFDNWGVLKYHPITEEVLIDILRFTMRPDTLQKLSLRRHHKTRSIWVINQDCLVPMVELVRS